MKKVLFALFFIPTLVFAQPQTTLPTAGLTPEHPFYFLDQLSENLQRFFTFNPDGEARLEVAFAKERIAEIKLILKEKGINAKGLSFAEGHLKDNLSRASTILFKEKQLGKDTRDITKELSVDFKDVRKDLKNTFEVEIDAVEVKIDELKAKIKEVRLTGNMAQVNLLTKEITALKIQKESIKQHEDINDDNHEEEDNLLDEAMELKEEAAEKIREAVEKKTDIMKDMKDNDVAVPMSTFNTFNNLLIQAKAAFTSGNYAEAKRFAKEAEKSLKLIEKDIEKIKDSEENKDDQEGVGEAKKKIGESVENKNFKEEGDNN